MATKRRRNNYDPGGRMKMVRVSVSVLAGLAVGALLLCSRMTPLWLMPEQFLLEKVQSKLHQTGRDGKDFVGNPHDFVLRKDSFDHDGDAIDGDGNDDDWTPNVMFGNYSMPITFDSSSGNSKMSDSIQAAFDVGLMECYGFAFVEARKTVAKLLALGSLTQEQQRESNHQTTKTLYCPMCHWLVAMTHSPYVNHPILADKHDFDEAFRATVMAYEDAHHPPNPNSEKKLSTKEIGLIDATNLRFSPPSSFENQTIGYELYKDKLMDLHQKLILESNNEIKGDPDVMAFLADSIMVLHSNADGYAFYDETTSEPKPAIAYAIDLLEICLENSPDHPLCQHLYIHVTEPSDKMVPRSGPIADNLVRTTADTEAQHLQHMPSHTYLRIGKYHDAVVSNEVAHFSDKRYEEHGAVAYAVAHDLVVLICAARLSGERAVALEYSEILRDHYKAFPEKPDGPGTEVGWHVWRTVRLGFADYEAILQDTDWIPPGGTNNAENLRITTTKTSKVGSWPYSVVLGHYAKGVASLWRAKKATNDDDRLSDARYHQTKLRETIPSVDPSFRGMVSVADWMLEVSIGYYDILSRLRRSDNTAAIASMGEIVNDRQQQQHEEETDRDDFDRLLEFLRSARAEQESWVYTEPPLWYESLWLCEGTLLRIMGNHRDAKEAFEKDLAILPENRYGLYGLWRVLKEEGSSSEDELRDIFDRYETASSWVDGNIREKPPPVCPELGE